MTPTDYKTHRLRAGLTQKQLAARLGLSRVTINRREKGHDSIGEEAALAVQSLANENNTLCKIFRRTSKTTPNNQITQNEKPNQ